VELPSPLRDELLDELEDFLDAIGSPEAEQVVTYLIEQLEMLGDEYEVEDVVDQMEHEGALEGSLQEALESEMTSNDEFEFTGEEVVTLLERVVAIEWDDTATKKSDDDDDDDDDDE